MDESTVRDLLPDWVAGRLEPGDAAAVERAVAADPDLEAEAGLLRALAAGRMATPPGLAERIRAAVRERPAEPLPASRRAPSFPWSLPSWGFAAAAVATVALAGVLAIEGRSGSEDPLRASLGMAASPWVTDDVMVAGAPVLEDLSDETLQALLEELGG